MPPSPRELKHAESKSAKYGVRWQRDGEATRCTACDRQFSVLLRRHHCRACGQIFCNKCSATRIQLRGSNNIKRVCCLCAGAAAQKASESGQECQDQQGGPDQQHQHQHQQKVSFWEQAYGPGLCDEPSMAGLFNLNRQNMSITIASKAGPTQPEALPRAAALAMPPPPSIKRKTLGPPSALPPPPPMHLRVPTLDSDALCQQLEALPPPPPLAPTPLVAVPAVIPATVPAARTKSSVKPTPTGIVALRPTERSKRMPRLHRLHPELAAIKPLGLPPPPPSAFGNGDNGGCVPGLPHPLM